MMHLLIWYKSLSKPIPLCVVFGFPWLFVFYWAYLNIVLEEMFQATTQIVVFRQRKRNLQTRTARKESLALSAYRSSSAGLTCSESHLQSPTFPTSWALTMMLEVMPLLRYSIWPSRTDMARALGESFAWELWPSPYFSVAWAQWQATPGKHLPLRVIAELCINNSFWFTCFLEFRMAYAFSRDGAMPLSSFWHRVNRQEVPINAVWLSALVSFCMALTVCVYHLGALQSSLMADLNLTPLVVAVSGKLGGVPSDGVDRHHRALRCVRDANLLQDHAGTQLLRCRALQPRSIWRDGGLGCSSLGGDHHGPLLLAGCVPHHEGHSQLHPGGGRRPAHPHRGIMAAERKTLVQGAHHKHQHLRTESSSSSSLVTESTVKSCSSQWLLQEYEPLHYTNFVLCHVTCSRKNMRRTELLRFKLNCWLAM